METAPGSFTCFVVSGVLILATYFVAYRLGYNHGWEEAGSEEKEAAPGGLPVVRSHQREQPPSVEGVTELPPTLA